MTAAHKKRVYFELCCHEESFQGDSYYYHNDQHIATIYDADHKYNCVGFFHVDSSVHTSPIKYKTKEIILDWIVNSFWEIYGHDST